MTAPLTRLGAYAAACTLVDARLATSRVQFAPLRDQAIDAIATILWRRRHEPALTIPVDVILDELAARRFDRARED